MIVYPGYLGWVLIVTFDLWTKDWVYVVTEHVHTVYCTHENFDLKLYSVFDVLSLFLPSRNRTRTLTNSKILWPTSLWILGRYYILWLLFKVYKNIVYTREFVSSVELFSFVTGPLTADWWKFGSESFSLQKSQGRV